MTAKNQRNLIKRSSIPANRLFFKHKPSNDVAGPGQLRSCDLSLRFESAQVYLTFLKRIHVQDSLGLL